MPILRRNNAKPLLRQVNGKPHATSNDHEEETRPTSLVSHSKTRPSSIPEPSKKNVQNKENEDIFADPASSSDEDAPQLPLPATSSSHAPSAFKQSKQLDVSKDLPAKSGSGFKPPPGISLASTTSKRSASNEGDEEEQGDQHSAHSDDMVFSSQASSQRKKPRLNGGGVAKTGNFHAPVKTGGRFNTYGKKRIVTSKDRKGKQADGFKTAKGVGDMGAVKGATFKTAKGADVFAFGEQEEEDSTGFQAARGGGSSDSPELSELSEPDSEVEELDARTLDLPAPKAYVPSEDCGVCGASVPVLLKQDFEDKYHPGEAASYKWQQRFCRYHKVEAAKTLWDERGYPEIKWEKLDRRLRGHHERLIAVLESRAPSPYRERLQKLLESGQTRSARTAFVSNKAAGSGEEEGDLEVKPGYYGPKGEKLMTEHILSHFAGRLRELATSDPLIKASGVAGGVSGFVQAVLVPEVAVALVREDLDVDCGRARRVLRESWEMGESLNEEADERVERIESEEEDF